MDRPRDSAGVINLFKPVGWSSAQYVYRLRPIFGTRKVGHAGALDPFADGVLLGCVGAATKLVERLMALPKHYRTTLRLGVTNETFDTERPFEPVPGAIEPSRDALARAVASLVGQVRQSPPAFSAMRIGGELSYKRAKRGILAELPARSVRIDRIDIEEYAWPSLSLSIRCGRGTYVRAIARDLGRLLGCGACCQALRRLAIGPYRAEAAIHLHDVGDDAVRLALVPVEQVRRRLDEAEEPAGRPGP